MTKEEQDKTTPAVIGSAMEVHLILGNGFQEVVYQRGFSYEMNLCNIQHQPEFKMPRIYKGQDISSRPVDFLAGGKIAVEIKSNYPFRRRTSCTRNELFRSLQFTNRHTYQLSGKEFAI
jgi:GxxExxY protein